MSSCAHILGQNMCLCHLNHFLQLCHSVTTVALGNNKKWQFHKTDPCWSWFRLINCYIRQELLIAASNTSRNIWPGRKGWLELAWPVTFCQYCRCNDPPLWQPRPRLLFPIGNLSNKRQKVKLPLKAFNLFSFPKRTKTTNPLEDF